MKFSLIDYWMVAVNKKFTGYNTSNVKHLTLQQSIYWK